jgi:hypothetical protein
MVGALDGFVSATEPAAAEKARAEALHGVTREVAVARAMEDWQGDADLRDALVACGKRLEDLLGHEFAEYSALARKKGGLTKKEMARADKLIRAGNEGIDAVSRDLAAAQQRFRDRWGITALLAWQAAQPGADPGSSAANGPP